MAASDGPADQGMAAPRQDGDAKAGRDVFRFETFGTEGFWTDAVRLPAGIKAAKVTPLQALKLGLSVDVEAVDAETAKELVKQLKEDPSGRPRIRSATTSRTGLFFKMSSNDSLLSD